MVSVVAGSGNAKPKSTKKVEEEPSTGKSLFDQMGLGPTEQGKRGGLGGIINFFSSKNSGSDPAAVKARKTEEDAVAQRTKDWRAKNNTLYHGPKGGAAITSAPINAPAAPATKNPGTSQPKTIKRATTTTVTPTPRPAQAAVKPTQQRVRAVQSWRGGDVPGQVRYDPGTKPNPTKKQRIGKSGGVHDFSGLKGFFK